MQGVLVVDVVVDTQHGCRVGRDRHRDHSEPDTGRGSRLDGDSVRHV